VYDENGRLVSSTTVHAPDWSDEDRGWVLAFMADQDDICSGCGHYISECRDPNTMGQWSPREVTCEACRILQAAADNVAESHARGVYIGTYRNTPG
jgi:hypothetical protein